MKVFVVYENSRSGNVKHVCGNRNYAKGLINNSDGELMDLIEPFEVEDYKFKSENFDFPIDSDCKHYDPKLEMIRELIACLYSLDGCSAGGIAHVLTDDNNFNDSTIEIVRQCCDEEPDRLEVPLVRLICDELSKMSIPQRALLFSGYYSEKVCTGCVGCSDCKIEKGEIVE